MAYNKLYFTDQPAVSWIIIYFIRIFLNISDKILIYDYSHL